ncbi:TetR/AcrR family transcriptional regulator [Amycolatopsis pigmentata]|uniref:TetR/AcrR family transcriptional regulator n=1 Tax=Amycolatopsis pigmentata TaxID=450801 RepID=A0ABW5G866_9PSEU
MDVGEEEGRSARKRRAIMDAAAQLFLRKGYQGTNMDQIAAEAAVSKQTVYKNFADKEKLFSAIVLGISERAETFVGASVRALGEDEDIETHLKELGRDYISAVVQPRVLRLRRLMVAEAGRFPELARGYYERTAQRTLTALAAHFRDLGERGLLSVDDPAAAARHFAFLILGSSLDRAMFGMGGEHAKKDLERLADDGVRVFLAAYRGT